MAQNEYVNKILYGDRLICDLSNITVTPSVLAKNYTAHAADGSPIVGTLEGGTQVEIKIVSFPKRLYKQNDTLDLSDLKVFAIAGEFHKDLTNECLITPSDGTILSEVGVVKVSIEYKTFVITFSVYVDCIPTWADSTDEELLFILNLHYSGDVNIYDYWNVGDERKFVLDNIGEVIFVLKEFTYSGNCIFSVEPKYLPFDYCINTNRHSGATWAGCSLRAYLNDTIYTSFGDIKSIFKEYTSAYNVVDRFSIPNSSVGIQTDSEGNPKNYWTGNRFSSDWAQYYYIDKNGVQQHNYSDYNYGVFMIGAI
jgi:hypothetical protein